MSESDSKRAWKRKVLLINPRFQLTFIAYMAIIAMTIIVVFYVSNIYFFKSLVEAGQREQLPADHIYFTYIDNQRTSMRWIFLLASVITMVNAGFWGLYLSHRVAGPIYRIRKHMTDMAEGRTDRDVGFREHDFFPELAESFNHFVKSMKDRFKG